MGRVYGLFHAGCPMLCQDSASGAGGPAFDLAGTNHKGGSHPCKERKNGAPISRGDAYERNGGGTRQAGSMASAAKAA